MKADGGGSLWCDRLERFGRGLENLLLAGLLASMLFIAGAQIVLRNLGGGGFPWADEALRIMVLWLAMLGGVAASRDNRHISVDVLARLLPRRGQQAAGALAAALTAFVCGLISWHAAVFVAQSREFGDQLLGGLPAWWFQAVLPAAFLLLGYRYAVWCLRRLSALFAREPAEWS